MATITNTEEVKFIQTPNFTDETSTLRIIQTSSLGQPDYIASTAYFTEVWLGMSLYGPANFSEDTMGVPFEQIDISAYYWTWDISKHQTAMRQMVDDFTSQDIYVYVKSLYNGIYYIHWHKCHLTIVNTGSYPIYTANPVYRVIDSLTQTLTGKTDAIIRYVTDVNVNFTAKAQKEGSIYAYSIKNGSQKIYYPVSNRPATYTASYTFQNCDSATFYTEVEDSRGYTKNNFVQVPNFIEYLKPTCRVEAQSPSSTGGSTLVTASGVAFNGSFGASTNTLTVKCRYQPSGGSWSSWHTMTVTRNGNNYTASTSITGLDYLTTYTFQAMATDAVNTVYSANVQSKAMPVFDWGEEDFRFNVPVNIIGDLVVSGTISSAGQDPGGNTGDAKVITSGTWTPVCAGCSSPDYSFGTYMRIGDTCVVNFYFQGTLTSSQEKLMITGLPFNSDTSYRWQAGGGFCNNYGVIATQTGSPSSDVDRGGHRFTGWSIEGNVIYGRAQDTTGNSVNYTETDYIAPGYKRSWHIVDDGYYIGGALGKQIYASGTICYKIDT